MDTAMHKHVATQQIILRLPIQLHEFRHNIVQQGILLDMNLGSPEYMSVLYQGAAGRVIMCGALALYIAAFVIGRRILDIHV